MCMCIILLICSALQAVLLDMYNGTNFRCFYIFFIAYSNITFVYSRS